MSSLATTARTLNGGRALTSLGRALQHGTSIRVASRQELFIEGAMARHVYFLESGTIEAYKSLADGRRQIVAFFYPGDMVGLPYVGVHRYSACALERAVLWRVARQELELCALADCTLQGWIMDNITKSLMTSLESLLALGRKTADERVAYFIIALSRNAAERGLSDNPVALPASQGHVADFLGLTNQTVCKALGRLRRAGVCRVVRTNCIWISDRARLEAISEGFWEACSRERATS